MACFITKTTIPFQSTPDCKVFTAPVGDSVWILFNDKSTPNTFEKQFFKFHTDSLILEKVDCVFPENMNGNVVEFISNRQNLYVVIAKSLEDTEYVLFKFDVNTLQWTFIMHIKNQRYVKYGPIVDDQLYLLKHLEYNKQSLTRVDLNSKKVTEIPFRQTYGRVNIMENNGEIFVVEHLHRTHTVLVSKVGNEQDIELDRYCFQNIEGKYASLSDFKKMENGHLLTVFDEDARFDRKNSTLYIERFDFETNKWTRASFPKCDRTNMILVGRLIMNGNRGLMILQKPTKRHQYTIQMFELFPKLSTICIFSQIDSTNDENDFKTIKGLLSDPLRFQLENMLKWKIAENDIKLKKQQTIGVVQEFQAIEVTGAFDHKMRNKLQSVFDSDYSDSEDSDIIDAENERFEESDDENRGQSRSIRQIHDERGMWWSEDEYRNILNAMNNAYNDESETESDEEL